MSLLKSLKRAVKSRLHGVRRSPVADSDRDRGMHRLKKSTDRILEDYRAGRITKDELREWLEKNDPARASGL